MGYGKMEYDIIARKFIHNTQCSSLSGNSFHFRLQMAYPTRWGSTTLQNKCSSITRCLTSRSLDWTVWLYGVAIQIAQPDTTSLLFIKSPTTGGCCENPGQTPL